MEPVKTLTIRNITILRLKTLPQFRLSYLSLSQPRYNQSGFITYVQIQLASTAVLFHIK